MKANGRESVEVANTTLKIDVAGEGQPMLFLNAGDAFHRSEKWMETASRHYRVYAPKYPGFGGGALVDHVRNVGHLALVCRELIEMLELEDVVLVGASFGGWVALELAVNSCDRLAKLVLIDTVGVKFGDETDSEIADIYSLGPDELRARRYHLKDEIPDYSAFENDKLVEIAEDWAGESYYAWKPYMHTPALYDWLWRVRVPTLVLWGEHDGIVSPEYGKRVASHIPQASFGVIKEAGHFPHVEQPGETLAKIRAFLDGKTA